MKRGNTSVCENLVCALILVAICTPVPSAAGQDLKMTPQELVSKHLAGVGTDEAWKAAASRAIAGWCVASFRVGGTGQADGTVRLESDGIKNVLMMQFNTPTYPLENLAYDGKNVTAGHIRPGQRSALSEFILAHDTALKEGLLAGTLSAAWPLADLENRRPRLKYNGVKKADGRELHELQYTPNKIPDLKITLYFDKQSFHHVRTQYRLSRAATMTAGGVASRDSSGNGPETHYVMTEDFTDFTTEGALTLPHSYKLTLSITGGQGTVLIDWVLHLNRFALSTPIDPKDFDVSK